MILTKSTKELLVNFAADFPFTFVKPDATGKEVAATAADATKLRIRGYADFIPVAGLTGSLLAQRAQLEVTTVISVDSAQAAQITTSGTNAAGAAATIILKESSSDPLSEYMTNMDKNPYHRLRVYTIRLPLNATPAQVIGLIANEINSRAVLFPEADEPAASILTATVTAGVLSIAAADSHISLRLYVDSADTYTGAIIPVLASVVTTPSYEGRGLYRNLKGGRLQTEGTNDPYAIPGPLELPVRNGKYTRVDFATTTARPELSNHGAADASFSTINKFGIYFKEGDAANEQAIADLVNFLSRADVSVSKTYYDQNQATNTTGVTKTVFLANAVV